MQIKEFRPFFSLFFPTELKYSKRTCNKNANVQEYRLNLCIHWSFFTSCTQIGSLGTLNSQLKFWVLGLLLPQRTGNLSVKLGFRPFSWFPLWQFDMITQKNILYKHVGWQTPNHLILNAAYSPCQLQWKTFTNESYLDPWCVLEILNLINLGFVIVKKYQFNKMCQKGTRNFYSAQPSTTDCRLWRSTRTHQTTQFCCLSFKVPGNFKKCHISNNWLFSGTLKLFPLDDFYFYTFLHLLLSSFCHPLSLVTSLFCSSSPPNLTSYLTFTSGGS